MSAVRTLPDGTPAETRMIDGYGWFGVVAEEDTGLDGVHLRYLDHGLIVTLSGAGRVLSVSKAGAKVTDSDLLYVLRELLPEEAKPQ